MVVPHKALKPRWKSANVSTGWLAQVAVRARPKRNGVMMRCRRQNFVSVPQALSRGSENTHWNLSATMLSCPWSIWDSFRCLYSNTPKRSFGWIAIKIHNKIKYLKVPTYDSYLEARLSRRVYPGFLFDYAQDIDRAVGDTKAYSPYLTIWVSEFQRFRLQYTYLGAPGNHDNQFFLQWTAIIGSHVHGFRDR